VLVEEIYLRSAFCYIITVKTSLCQASIWSGITRTWCC